MNLTTEKLKEILVSPGFITKEQFQKALKESKKSEKALEDILINC